MACKLEVWFVRADGEAEEVHREEYVSRRDALLEDERDGYYLILFDGEEQRCDEFFLAFAEDEEEEIEEEREKGKKNDKKKKGRDKETETESDADRLSLALPASFELIERCAKPPSAQDKVWMSTHTLVASAEKVFSDERERNRAALSAELLREIAAQALKAHVIEEETRAACLREFAEATHLCVQLLDKASSCAQLVVRVASEKEIRKREQNKARREKERQKKEKEKGQKENSEKETNEALCMLEQIEIK